MGNATTTALNRLLEPLSQSLGAEAARQILDLRVAPSIQDRVTELADLCNEGLLSEEERAEYDAYVEGLGLINVLKAKARRVLAAPPR